MYSQSFAPLCTTQVKLFVLGSMPGVASLKAQQYYAHPRNLFWPLMCDFFNWKNIDSYEDKVNALMAEGIGLWDVMSDCYRRGSLDQNIKKSTVQINDFIRLMEQYPTIETFLLNGKTAAQLFQQKVIKANKLTQPICSISLPSTSPANASMSYLSKKQLWHQALKDALKR